MVNVARIVISWAPPQDDTPVHITPHNVASGMCIRRILLQ